MKLVYTNDGKHVIIEFIINALVSCILYPYLYEIDYKCIVLGFKMIISMFVTIFLTFMI